MTEQYAQPNINNPRRVRSFTAVAGPPIAIQLTFDDGLVVADTTDASIGFTLPLASQFPGWQIIIKATNAGTSGSPVFVAGQAGETIDGAAFVLMTTDEEALFLKSDGANWRVVGGVSGATASSLSLDLTFDDSAMASIPPVLFITWAEILAAIAIIPGNPAGLTPYVTPYRLNIATTFGITAGVHDLSNAHFRTIVKESPDGAGTLITGSGFFTFENTASVNGITIRGPSFGPTFSWPTYDFAEIHDSAFVQTINGPPGPGILLFPLTRSVLRATGTTEFGIGAIEAGSAPGDILTIDAYDQCDIFSSALAGPGDVDINVFSGATSISLSHGGLGGTLDLNLGGGTPDYTQGETILFSSGGPIDFAAATEQELYAGGTNPPGAPPQTPSGATPFRGYVAPRDGYLRGVGVRIPTTFAPFLLFDVTVYISGTPVIVESFTTLSASQFDLTTFGKYDEGDGIVVTITPTTILGGASLPDGIVVSLRSA